MHPFTHIIIQAVNDATWKLLMKLDYIWVGGNYEEEFLTDFRIPSDSYFRAPSGETRYDFIKAQFGVVK